MNSNKFRKELQNVMPGYNWTVHRLSKFSAEFISATGIQSSGFNRLSTLYVIRTEREDAITYEVMSAGYGKRAPWLHKHKDGTLKRALRGLQNYYEGRASLHSNHAGALETGRAKPNTSSRG